MLAVIVSNSTASALCPVGCPVPESFYDDFSDGIDESKWLIAHKTWGSKNDFINGGVVEENVVANTTTGTVAFHAHGKYYTGDVVGINKDLTRQTTGVLTGGAMATRWYFGAGSYEVKMRVADDLGVCSAIWTFFYNDDGFCSSGEPIVNHEIDIELPGSKFDLMQKYPCPKYISFAYFFCICLHDDHLKDLVLRLKTFTFLRPC